MPPLAVALSLLCRIAAAQEAPDAKLTDPAAQKHFDDGKMYFETADFDRAIEEFKQGFYVEKDPAFLLWLGESYRMNHQCEKAIAPYEAVLSKQPGAVAVSVAREGLRQCGAAVPAPPAVETPAASSSESAPPARQLAAAAVEKPREAVAASVPVLASAPPATPTTLPAALPSAAPPPVPPLPPVPPPPAVPPTALPPAARASDAPAPPASSPRPWYRDEVGDAFAGIGLAGLAVGTAFLLQAGAEVDAANHAPSLDSYRSNRDAAYSDSMSGAVSLVVGTSLLAVGVGRYLFDESGAQTEVSVVPVRGGASATIAGRF